MSTSFVFGSTALNSSTYVPVYHPDGAHDGTISFVMENASTFVISDTVDGTVNQAVAAGGLFGFQVEASGEPAPVLFYAKATTPGNLIVSSLRR